MGGFFSGFPGNFIIFFTQVELEDTNDPRFTRSVSAQDDSVLNNSLLKITEIKHSDYNDAIEDETSSFATCSDVEPEDSIQRCLHFGRKFQLYFLLSRIQHVHSFFNQNGGKPTILSVNHFKF